MKRIFVINGLPRSGKDTFAEFVGKFAKVTNVSSVDFIKQVAKFAGWDGEKDEKGRLLLSNLKSILTQYNDIPYNKIAEQIKKFHDGDNEIMFIHIREPKEIERIVKDYGAESIIVRRKSNESVISNNSDANVEKYNNYTFVVNNDSDLSSLEEKAKRFVQHLTGIESTENK